MFSNTNIHFQNPLDPNKLGDELKETKEKLVKSEQVAMKNKKDHLKLFKQHDKLKDNYPTLENNFPLVSQSVTIFILCASVRPSVTLSTHPC